MSALTSLLDEARAILEDDIGDSDFPLDADIPRDVVRDHELVGVEARVTPYAKESLRPFRGQVVQVTGVILRRGAVVGWEFVTEGKKFWAPKKDLFVGRRYVEDVHLNSARADELREGLAHFAEPHDYFGTAWDGVELLCFELASFAEEAAVEVPKGGGWYRYESSAQDGQDGKDWRYVIPDRAGPIVVNAHSLLHDGVWTLSTTVYSSRASIDPSKLQLVRNADHWTRTLDWTIRTAEALQTQGYDYAEAIKGLRARRRVIPKLRQEMERQLPAVRRAYRKLEGKPWKMPYISIGSSHIRQQPQSVGMHEAPTDLRPYSVITVSPDALDNESYLRAVVKHELIHAALDTTAAYETVHGERFQKYAQELKLEPKYRK